MGARLTGFSAGIGLLIAATFGLTASAEADARACRRLEARLASLESSGNSDPAIYQRYDAAVSEQRDELAAARQRARGLECDVQPGFDDQCNWLNLKIERMEANLADLQRNRDALAKRQDGGYDRERAMLQAQMQAEGCSGDRFADRYSDLESSPVDQASNEGDLFELLSGEGSQRLRTGEDNVISIPSGGDDFSIRAYRTMCVRTCDGYYFPMSPASSRDDFARDQQNCESICPGTDIRIYYQPSGLSDVSTMMSAATEELYPDLPTAYLYRRADVERPPACGCGQVATVQNYSVIAGAGSAAEETQGEPAIPHPWARPDSAADPETLANAEGGLDGAEIRELLKPKAPRLPPPGERKVRVVGPAFLPDRSREEAPPVPDRTTVR